MINVLLCRWKNGWREVIEPQSIGRNSRHEALFSLGAIQSPEEVDRIGTMQLKTSAWTRTAVACDHDPIDRTDRPYRSYNVGDTIIVPRYGTGTYEQRVRAITGSEDENGDVTYAPELGDLLLEEDERVLQLVKKMSDGTLNGEAPAAQPTRVYYPPMVAQSRPRRPEGVGLHSLHPAGGQAVSWTYDGSALLTVTTFRMKGDWGDSGAHVINGRLIAEYGDGGAYAIAVIDPEFAQVFDISVDIIPAFTFGPGEHVHFQLSGDPEVEGLDVELWAGNDSSDPSNPNDWYELQWPGGG